ncbi:hypothetical protein KUTeg_010752, partial [Tegillarca granosa]
ISIHIKFLVTEQNYQKTIPEIHVFTTLNFIIDRDHTDVFNFNNTSRKSRRDTKRKVKGN